MARGKEPLLAYLTNNVYGQSSYEQALWTGVCKAAETLGVRLCTFAGNELDEAVSNGKHLFDMARRSDAEGFIINTATIAHRMDHEQLRQFVNPFLSRPTACIAHEFPGAYFVAADNVHGMSAMIRHLVKNLGARRVAYVSGPLTHPEAADRFAAYQGVLKEFGIPFDQALVFEGTWVAPSGQKAVSQWIEKGVSFDAVASANDLMALDVLQELQQRNISVPNDVLVSGFDNIVDSLFSTPKLTTVAQPIEQIGFQAVQVVLEAIENRSTPRRVLVPAVLQVRGTAPGTVARPGSETGGGQPVGGKSGGPGQGEAPAQPEVWLNTLISTDSPAVVQALGPVIQKVLDGGTPRIDREFWLAVSRSSREDLEALASLCQAAFHSLEQKVSSGPVLFALCQLLRQVETLVSETRETELFHRGSQNEEMARTLAGLASRLAEAQTLGEFERTAAKHFPGVGIRSCRIYFYEEEDNPSSLVRLAVWVSEGQSTSAQERQKSFDSSYLTAGGLREETTRDWVCLPLLFESKKIGYVLLSHDGASPFLYKPLVEQIANRMHNLLLIKKIEKAEEDTKERTSRLISLIRPLLPVITSAAELAREQTRSMTDLIGANKATSGRILEAGRQVETLQKNLEKIVSLNDVIDDLSETINVIAINAAIAAARAGADGKVFGVISNEIRKLSVQTKTNNTEISHHLELLQQNSNAFFQSNDQARRAFTLLDTRIQEVVQSLEALQSHLTDLNGRAGLVLNTIAE